jgi:hypothetical protein
MLDATRAPDGLGLPPISADTLAMAIDVVGDPVNPR